MQLDQPITGLDDPDPLYSVRQASADVFAPTGEETDACRACNWNPWCGGGCPLLRNTPAHASYCQVYREMFPDLLKLEGQRLSSMHSLLQ
jgi:sulfatase maturation enzyme AslB (radical SAM superfamily)